MGDASSDGLTMECPVACVIRVRGTLAPTWSDYLGGLQITTAAAGVGDAGVTTELRGELLDQAALMGVVMTLYDRQLPLISVACVPAHSVNPLAPAGVPGDG